MADKQKKNEKNEQPKEAAVVTVENVMDQIRKGNLVDQALTGKVMEDIQKEKDERKARELKTRVLEASYRRLLALIQVRKRRREEEITLEKLHQAEILEDKLCGFELTEAKIKRHGGKDGKLTVKDVEYAVKKDEKVWVPASITAAEYDDLKRDLDTEINKKMTESEREFNKNKTELTAGFPDYYSWRWDW